MRRNDLNEIDEMFKDGLEDMDVSPNENLWDKIKDGLEDGNLEEIDEIFSESLEGASEIPSDKVWMEVEKQLPLNLYVKRRLKSLSAIASVLVVAMVVVMFVMNRNNQNQASFAFDSVMNPMKAEMERARIYAASFEPSAEETLAEEVKSENRATDNTIKKNIKSVKIRKEDAFIVDFENVDEEKIRQLLQPLQPLPMDSAIAKVVDETEKNTTIIVEEEIIGENPE